MQNWSIITGIMSRVRKRLHVSSKGHEDAIAEGRFDFERHRAGHFNYDWKQLFVPDNHKFSW